MTNLKALVDKNYADRKEEVRNRFSERLARKLPKILRRIDRLTRRGHTDIFIYYLSQEEVETGCKSILEKVLGNVRIEYRNPECANGKLVYFRK